jgi:hypothetical protein
MEYVPLDQYARVNEFVENHRLTRSLLREISKINHELLARRERL